MKEITSLQKPDKSSELKLCMLASGSKGNSIYISDGHTSVLIDAGLSGIEIERRMKANNLAPDNLDAIVVSHEHSDHISGVGVLSRRFSIPVYISHKTQKAASSFLGRITEFINFECGTGFNINGLCFYPFSLSHDAKDTSGFTVSKNKTKIGIATDLGIATTMVKENLKKCSILILEANHDPDMLANGPYPWPLKQRIKSRSGHLSNQDSKILLQEIQHNNLEHVILSHISETNNTPEKVLSVVGCALTCCKAKIDVARQDRCGAIINSSYGK
ncbi:MAG: MBL fold metallo-hydrolase [Pseudomonadota bacterium]